jgi:hypothetical protein
LGVFPDIKGPDEKAVILIKLRNPWGRSDGVWKGKWHINDKIWKK